MRNNIIILTVGIAGSSVLTHLIARGGYWMGEDTFKKPFYDTHENAELVRLNKDLLARCGIGEDYIVKYEHSYIDDVAALYHSDDAFDKSDYQAFADQCRANQPWIWKDPRLWVTMPFWEHYIDLARTQFIIISRDPMQYWISCTLRRQIQTYAYLQNHTSQVLGSIRQFLDQRQLPRFELIFEDLMLRPERTIAGLNDYLGTELSVDDLKAVNNSPLGKKNHGAKNFAKAALIYAKNYSIRYK